MPHLINALQDADVPKEAKAAEETEAASSEPVKDSQADAPPKENTESTPPAVSLTSN